ncbi:MAG TPA: ADOP family duplicated permease [Candidatus Acidoferrales bacterium]
MSAERMTAGKPRRPPRLAHWLVTRLLPPAEREFLLGDLEEQHAHIEQQSSRRAADRWFWGQALRLTAVRWTPPAVEVEMERRKGDSVMQNFWQDLSYGTRLLAKSPGFTAVAVLTLALGIGANATIFSWLNAVLLEPIPGAEAPSELVMVSGTSRAQANISLSYPDFKDLRSRAQSFTGMTMQEENAFALAGDGPPERIYGQFVSGSFFDVLGVRMLRGRGFLPEEDEVPGKHPVAVISYPFWQRKFGGDEGIVGRTITLNNQALTVVGVAPPEFQGSFTGLIFEVWMPVMLEPTFFPGSTNLENRGNRWFTAVARLKPGVTVGQAQAELSTLAQQISAENPNTNEGIGAVVHRFSEAPRGAQSVLRPVLLMLMGVVGVVLLIACANVANLLLARATGRRKEIAVRLALGASRARLMRQLLTESALLGLMAGAVALVITFWTSGLLFALVPATDMPIYLDLQLNTRVLVFTLAMAVLTGLVFGFAPALNATRAELTTALKDESGSVAGGRTKGWLRNSLVVVQVTLSLVLLIAAGLFLRSLDKAQTFNPGFNPRGVLLAGIDLLPSGYTSQQGRQFYEQLIERLDTIPGVTSAALSRRVPLGFGGSSSSSMRVEGYEPAQDEQVWSFIYNVGPDYLRTMEIPLVRGREFTREDKLGQTLVAVINETLVERYWKDRDPIGSRIFFGPDPITIVGVARNSKYRQLNEAPAPMVYLSLLQFYRSDANLHVRTDGDPMALAGPVQEVIRSLDPNLPVYALRTLEGNIEAASFQQRLAGNLLGVFGALALLLAAVGIYGVISYAVGQRTHEIGIRMALGAQPRDILRLVVGHGMLLTGIGLVLGTGAAFGAAQLMSSLLFGVGATDPLTFVGVPIVLGAVALLACWLPAHRATRVDPIKALRYE